MSYIFTNLKAKSEPTPARDMKSSSASDLFKAHIDNMPSSINTKKGIDKYAKKFWNNYKKKPNTPKSPKSPKSPNGAAKKDNTVARKIREKGINIYIKDLWDDFKKRRTGVADVKSADSAVMDQPTAPANFVVTQFRRMVTSNGTVVGQQDQSANSDNAVVTQMRGRIIRDEGGPVANNAPTSYNNFIKTHYNIIKNENPNFSKKKILKEISKMWKENKLTDNIAKSSSSYPPLQSQNYLLSNIPNSTTNRFNLYTKYKLPEYKFVIADNLQIPTNIAKNKSKSSSSPRPSARPSARSSARPSPKPRSSSDSELDRNDPDYSIKKAFKKLDRQKARSPAKPSPKRKSKSPAKASSNRKSKSPAKPSPKRKSKSPAKASSKK